MKIKIQAQAQAYKLCSLQRHAVCEITLGQENAFSLSPFLDKDYVPESWVLDKNLIHDLVLWHLK